MNKKFMLITALILAAVFLFFIAWLVFRKDYQPASTPVINSSQLPAGSSGAIAPVGQSDISGNVSNNTNSQQTVPTPLNDNQNPPVIPENFQWARYLYYNDNADSQKVLKYLATNKIEERLVLASYNLKTNNAYFQALANAAAQCGLTKDPSTAVPLVYDRVTAQCYSGYNSIVSYLDQELKQ